MHRQWLEYGRNPIQLWLYRRRWWCRVMVAVILLPWLGQYSWARWTTEPVNPSGLKRVMNPLPPAKRPPAHLDCTRELLDAVADLPLPPSDNEPLMPYFGNPATRNSLAKIASLSEQPFCIDAVDQYGQVAALRRAVKILACRAGMRVGREGDYAAAAEDLNTILNLAAELENDGTYMAVLVGLSFRSPVLTELLFWCREYELDPEQCAPLSILLDRHPLNRQALWQTILEGECKTDLRLLDNFYTRGGGGNGSMVPTAIYIRNGEPAHPIMRSFNLFSFVLPDRQEATRAIRGHYQAATAFRPVRTVERFDMFGQVYIAITRADFHHRGARIALALERYHHRRGEYPDSLQALVPQYLAAIPEDPFDRRPLRYQLQRDGSYLIWSVGADGLEGDGRSSTDVTNQIGYVLPHHGHNELTQRP